MLSYSPFSKLCSIYTNLLSAWTRDSDKIIRTVTTYEYKKLYNTNMNELESIVHFYFSFVQLAKSIISNTGNYDCLQTRVTLLQRVVSCMFFVKDIT